MDEQELNEFNYKINAIIDYLKENNGHKYKLYAHACPDTDEPDSDIIEFAEDVKDIVNNQFNSSEEIAAELPF